MSYFSQSKSEDKKSVNRPADARVEPVTTAGAARQATETVSVLARGMLVTGNIVCAGSVQILGRVVGDIHAGTLIVGEGANVQGNVMAQETVVQGHFKGTIHSNSVKLQSTAVVEGEILKQSLTIEPNAQFEGMSRRLERPVEAPTSEQVKGERFAAPGTSAEVVSISGAFGPQ